MKKKECLYCNGIPAPHFVLWYNYTLNIFFGKFQKVILDNRLSQFLSKRLNGVPLMFGVLRKLGVATYHDEPQKGTHDRARVIWESLKKRGYNMQEIKLFKKHIDTYVVHHPHLAKPRTYFTSVPRPSSTLEGHLSLIDDKYHFRNICAVHGLPVAQGGTATTLQGAFEIFEQIKKPVIIKPRMGSRGRHTFTYITTREDLIGAFREAKKLCFWVVIEEQIFGPVYRGTVINYKTEGLLEGIPAYVTGDGKKTIRQIIDKKNRDRIPQVSEVVMNDKMRWFLEREYRHMMSQDDTSFETSAYDPYDIFDYIPKKGVSFYLAENIGVVFGGMSGEKFDACHAENRQLFEDAARALQDPIIGFDFMIPDITRSWKKQHCALIEANTLPFFHLHHTPETGKPRDVASKICDLMGWEAL